MIGAGILLLLQGERVGGTWMAPGPVDDALLAGLPFPTAQRVLGGSVVRGSAVRTSAEWHADGPNGYPELGSYAIAREDGPLTELIGERLRVSYQARSVYAYCYRGAEELDEDLSLTRSLFVRLGLLDRTALAVTVEVVS